ncbi:uncharacterized protein E0L32_010556 [Thyridium curvatum]|uniref:Precorrin-2 dehydrogenase n=1 Tax=Thyridium curvatum TaxID=1093900 RepID=A0A507AN95_9PEZI|nr:uncharacterized protein E0L32_010556 [Thyridium curvatum]TPX07764.1 hypothetical protein E0L32_010556 [Thyridium curvatum]
MAQPQSSPSYHTSLLTALDCRSHIHLVIGSNPLAAARCGQSISAGATPILIAPAAAELHYGLQQRIDAGEVKWLQKPFEDADLSTLGREEVDHVVDAVFVTSGTSCDPAHISALCRRKRIPVNVVDSPHLCTFSLLSTHTDGPLQIGVTTNGRGCKLASRIRREVAASLPKDLGAACARLGDVRRRIRQEDVAAQHAVADDLDDSVDQSASFNRLVLEADLDAAKNRRMRWLSQVCEYWPLKRLAAITDADAEAVLSAYPGGGSLPTATTTDAGQTSPAHNPNPNSVHGGSTKKGRIILAGSGPGHPDLLTRATHRAILAADLVLADKLVPQGVLDLVPRRTPVTIARKFPGNADAAQEELHEAAIAAARSGLTVVRLKQGDPFLYGRGGEEVERFRAAGLGAATTVLPGVTSALSAPLFAGVPPTQRDVADQVLICTGTGKKGKPPAPPGYRDARTVVFLMALHRISGLVAELTERTEQEVAATAAAADGQDSSADGSSQQHKRRLWPRSTPCAVIERASCPDQKVIRTTLAHVVEAIEQEGSRPPGLLVVGKACEALYTPGKGRSWVVEDGFKGLDLDELVTPGMAALA